MARKNRIASLRGALLLVLLLSFLKSNAQTTFIKHYSTKDGLPSNTCYFTLQDSKGYIWIASDAGVSRFDGKVFEVFSVDDGLPDNQIIRIMEDHSGRIWFSALNGRLSYFKDGIIYNEGKDKLLRLLSFKGIYISIFEDSRQHLWFGTNKNILLRWDGRSLTRFTSARDSAQFINTFMYEDRRGRLWAQSEHSLHLLEGKSFKNVTQGSAPLSYKTALNLPNHTLLYLDSKGLNLRDGSQHQLLLPISSRLLERSPGYLYADLSNQVWLATSDGVYHLRGKDVPDHYLPEVVTSQVLKDRGGNLWMTTNNGIYMLPQEKKRIYILDSSQGLSNDGVKSLASDDRGRLWLGLDKGHINILSKSGPRVSRINLPDKSRFNAIKQLLFDKKGKTIFFGSDYGLGMISTDIIPYGHVSYLHELNNSRYVLKNFTLSTSRHLAMALSSGVVILTDPVKHPTFASASYKEGENFFNGRSYRAFYDRAQHLWFSNIFGLQELTGQQPYPHHTQHPLLSKRINDMGQLEDGTMVLATDGFGLLFYKNGQITRRITRENGLSNNICKRLFLEKDYLWVVTNNAVNRILLKAGHPVESFDYTNSILDNDVNELYIAKDTAYFATNHGLVFFAKRPFDRTQEIPRAMISAIFSNKHLLSTSTPVVHLSAAENNISFYYSAADFQNNTLIYRYRLKPGDSWSETKNRRLDFFAVEPGAYTFELSARTSNSQWGKSAKVNFVVKAHFWQSVWFILLLILAAGLTFYKLALIVTKQQKDKEQQRLLLRNKILMLEQQALQAMMNPHFVFNVMNSIQHYINTKNTSSANQILTGFARLIRKNLDMCTKSFISVEEELAYLNLYLKLEKTRFGDQLTYSIQIDDRIDQDETMIPSMILQPYIENAIWHGIMPKGAGGKLVIVMKLDTEDNLIISITDDGIGIENSIRDKQEDHVSKGMKLTRDRISLLNQIVQYPIQITINQNGTAGTTISILVPSGR